MESKLLRRSLLTTNSTELDLQLIIAHIMQDSAEKADEILVKTQEEFKNERVREILQGFGKVDEEYNMKETRTKRDSLVYESKMKNLSRLKVLQTKYEHVEDVLLKAKRRLGNKDMSTHTTPYKEILKALIIQGLCKLLEPKVTVTVRKIDMALVRTVLLDVKLSYENVTGLPVELHLSEGKYLNPSSDGGVLLSSPDYTVTLDNTLFSRLEMIGYYILPEINILLFGENQPEPVPIKPPSYLPPIFGFDTDICDEVKNQEISLTGLSIEERSIKESSITDFCNKKPM